MDWALENVLKRMIKEGRPYHVTDLTVSLEDKPYTAPTLPNSHSPFQTVRQIQDPWLKSELYNSTQSKFSYFKYVIIFCDIIVARELFPYKAT